MTLTEFCKLWNENEADWRELPNGGFAHKNAVIHPEAEITGGVFWGGVFWGGVFHDGVFRGGVFHDGEFHGGVFWGGVFHDGVFRGGVFHDGVFHDGEFWGGIGFSGSKHFGNLAKPGHIQIGCKLHTFEHWAANVEAIARENGYSEIEAQEYRIWVDALIAVGKLRGFIEKPAENGA